MGIRNNKRRNGLIHAWTNFSQSEKSSLPRGGVKILVSTDEGEMTEKIRRRGVTKMIPRKQL